MSRVASRDVLGRDDVGPLILVIPIVKLTSHIDGATVDNTPTPYVSWNDWEATGTGWAPDPHLLCGFRGSRHVSSSGIIPGPQMTNFVDVWDFSGVRVVQVEPRHYSPEILPCAQRQVALHIQMTDYHPIAITKDGLIFQVRGPIAFLIVSHCDVTSTGTGSRHVSSFSKVLHPSYSLQQDSY